jgi:1-acyl-sn-glycerol-3-phosphate acyltransferase
MFVPNNKLYKVVTSLRFIVNKLFLGSAKGLENIPKSPFILACNHISIPDAWLISNLVKSKIGQSTWFIARDDFWFNRRFTRYISKKLGALIIDWRHPSKVLNPALKILQKKGVIGVFPEAARNSNTKILLKGKTGVARLALWTGYPVVPVGYYGPPIASTLQVAKNFALKRNLSKIIFGEPLYFEKKNNSEITKQDLYNTTDNIMIKIGKLCNKRPQLHN